MATYDSTKDDLQSVLKDISKGKIQLPEFQRDWVWDDEHVGSLLVRLLTDKHGRRQVRTEFQSEVESVMVISKCYRALKSIPFEPRERENLGYYDVYLL